MEQNKFFPEVNGNFAFGCMRLPMNGEEVDYGEFSKMADAFIDAGFNYFDTAHGYINGKSEIAIRECLSKRHDRSEFLLTNKLTDPYFNSQEDIRPFLEKQLELCGVDYFDFYLMHAQNKDNYKKFQRCKAYETAYQFKQEGLIRHLGISFHDRAEVLDMILTEHPEIEVVQIQFNYLDFEDPSVQSRKVYEVCEKHGKPVLVMEPVKGGNLVNLPAEADKILRDLNGGSNASYAVRFAASFPSIAVVLSGMSDMAQMNDNISAMKDFEPLSETEMAAVGRVTAVFKGLNLIPCTSCRYCIEENHCPKDILIPDLFAALNAHEAFSNWNAEEHYKKAVSDGHGKASDCVKCGMCERVCPQHLNIRELLPKVAAAFNEV
ncbi:aldo/keto reductase [Butyrivibrio sp. FCS014]|uniref:aldo/keto reductase n=1 Tax=Butyrivibrio sp. FCS014 TaxID=1408304 RepID=UPI0004643D48|nr:aldo/keto reductase [Butyrivibrio sp. FCS014]